MEDGITILRPFVSFGDETESVLFPVDEFLKRFHCSNMDKNVDDGNVKWCFANETETGFELFRDSLEKVNYSHIFLFHPYGVKSCDSFISLTGSIIYSKNGEYAVKNACGLRAKTLRYTLYTNEMREDISNEVLKQARIENFIQNISEKEASLNATISEKFADIDKAKNEIKELHKRNIKKAIQSIDNIGETIFQESEGA